MEPANDRNPLHLGFSLRVGALASRSLVLLCLMNDAACLLRTMGMLLPYGRRATCRTGFVNVAAVAHGAAAVSAGILSPVGFAAPILKTLNRFHKLLAVIGCGFLGNVETRGAPSTATRLSQPLLHRQASFGLGDVFMQTCSDAPAIQRSFGTCKLQLELAMACRGVASSWTMAMPWTSLPCHGAANLGRSGQFSLALGAALRCLTGQPRSSLRHERH